MSLYLHVFNRISSFTPLQLAQRLAFDVCDEALIEELCVVAHASPTALAALRWMAVHDVKMTIGALKPGVLGNYCQTKRRITLAAHLRHCVGAAEVGVLVHEIRHAWQDARGLLPHMSLAQHCLGRLDFALLQNALCEADAHAYGMQAADEINNPLFAAQSVIEKQVGLQHHFIEWFTLRAKSYAQRMRTVHGQSLQAMTESQELPTRSGINPYDRAHLVALGRAFAGNGNYITSLQRDVFVKFVTAPAEILRDYSNDAVAAAHNGGIVKAQMNNRKALRVARSAP